MSLLLYINGQLMDLDPLQAVAQTKQVNDLNSLDNRQAGYTNKFKLPKTANNIRALDYLTLAGNISNVPYQKNPCSLYSDTGECFVYNGRAVITDAGESYEAVLYDGVIDLFKAIENTTLADLGPHLDLINHNKSLAAIHESWTQDKAYRYIVADYNGDMNPQQMPLFPLPLLQTDYLVPAVKVSYLWDKVMEHYGFGYSGSIFQHEDFTNLWLTYPKGVTSSDDEKTAFESSEWEMFNGHNSNLRLYPIKFSNSENDSTLLEVHNGMHLRVLQTGYYRLDIEGIIQVHHPPGLAVYKNIHTIINGGVPLYNTSINPGTPLAVIDSNVESNTQKQYAKVVYLQAGDYITLVFSRSGAVRFYDGTSLSVKLTALANSRINFTAAFADFSTTDFLKEIVHRFGLTLFKHKYENSYEFLTLKEQLEKAPVIDWSSKFARKGNEAYIYGSYARRNWFRYNYSDKEASHNDFYIDAGNENLPETRDAIKSKIYSPDNGQGSLMGRAVNIYRLWDKEVVENPEEGEDPVTYKSLDKRFYLMRNQLVPQPVILQSKATQQSLASDYYYAESFSGLSFSDIIPAYYSPLKDLLEKALIVNAELYLKDSDIVNFDFRNLYYIDRLSGCFLINKINGYIPGRPVKCELVRVNHTPVSRVPVQVAANPKAITITQVKHTASLNFSIEYEANFSPAYDFIFQYSHNGQNWTTAATSSNAAVQHITVRALSAAGYFRILYAADKVTSNIFALN